MRQLLTIYDENSIYCERLSEYLRNNLKLSFDICTFTEAESFMDFAKKRNIGLAIFSQSSADRLLEMKTGCRWKNTVILDEREYTNKTDHSNCFEEGNLVHISKYLPASEILKGLLDFIYSRADDFSGIGMKGRSAGCRVIGFYTPISRSGQTTLAVRMGEKLSREGKSILISLESFSSIGSMFPDEAPEDITDLIYYLDCENESFCLYLEKIKKSRNGLDFIAPAKTAMQIREISCEKIKELIEHLSQDAGYEYILLDLKDYPEDFFDILSMCDVVFTINRNNSADHYRIGRYNMALTENGYEKVLTKTVKFLLPDIRNFRYYNSFVEALISEGREVESIGA